jgi:hypothetical protein
VVRRINPIYEKLGWEDTGSFTERYLRANVIKNSVYFNIKEALEKAEKLFKDYMDGKK